jgi:hypothetical protein
MSETPVITNLQKTSNDRVEPLLRDFVGTLEINAMYRPFETLGQVGLERCICLLVAGKVRQKTAIWVVDRLCQIRHPLAACRT